MEDNSMVASYKTLRTMIGVLGILLPVLVVAFSFIKPECCCIQGSISDYHNSASRNIFVGILCAVSCFLFVYNGYDKKDFWVAKIAGVAGVLVAMFPATTVGKPIDCILTTVFERPEWFHVVHIVSAIILFCCFAYFCLFLFTKSASHPTRQKVYRNRIYRICGWLIIVCMLLVAFCSIRCIKEWLGFSVVFGLETIMLWAFGFSWFVKGDHILKDKSSSKNENENK